MTEPTKRQGGRGWCKTLGIERPTIEAVAGLREANTFALLIVALLERDEPMTLADAAEGFEAAGVMDYFDALLSLQRRKPGRPPLYRDGDLYHVDAHSDEARLWVSRLGLRPPRVPAAPQKAVEPAPLPGPETALTSGELDEAWKQARLTSWSAQRLAVAVLDAAGGPLPPAEVVAAVTARTQWHGLREDRARFTRRGSAIGVRADGRWAIVADAGDNLKQARVAVRERVAASRREAATRVDPEVAAQMQAAWEQRREANAAVFAAMSRALLVGFPPARPEAVALLDVGAHELTTFVGDELAALPARLLDETIAAPWVHWEEHGLYQLKKAALAADTPLEVVVGSAPGWADPWARARIAHVEGDPAGLRTWLVDEEGSFIDDFEVQRARLAEVVGGDEAAG